MKSLIAMDCNGMSPWEAQASRVTGVELKTAILQGLEERGSILILKKFPELKLFSQTTVAHCYGGKIANDFQK